MPLILDSFTVTFLAGELDLLLKGRELRGVYISDDRVLSISLKGDKGSHDALRFLHAPGFALLCVDRQAENESDFTHLPRFESLLQGAMVAGVEQVDLDRIVRVALKTAEGGGLRLYFELNPSLPNLCLTDEEDTILAILLKAGTRTRGRRLDTGRHYAPQPMPCRIHPSEVDEKYLSTLNRWQDEKVLSQSVMGIGPFFSREIAHRARESGSFYKAYDGLMRAYREGNSKPHTFASVGAPHGRPAPIGIVWFPPRQGGLEDIRSMETFNKAAADVLKNLTISRAFDRRKGQVTRTLEREIRKLKRVEAEAQEAESDGEKARVYKKYGELIMANLDRLRKGDRHAVLPDLHAGGIKRVRIELRPELTPQRNAQAYFKRARKSARRAELAQEKLEAAGRRLSSLQPIYRELQELTDARRLTEIEEKILFAAPRGGKEKPPEDEKALRLGIKPRRYEVAEGWTVLVGRSAGENDTLTHRYASPSDLWFHARQAQGAHVVLRKPKREAQPPKQVILDAAAIAAYYSKARTSTHVPVSYAEKRYVKKVKKGPPGTAAMLREKVVFVDPRLPKP